MTTNLPPVSAASLANVPLPGEAGVWGVCPGVGLIADVIRRATESWAGHAVMYVGGGQIVQATWPRVEVAQAPTQNVIWATGQPLNATQRSAAANKALALVGTGYDIWAYPVLAAAVVYAEVTKDLSHLFGNDKWWDCSGLIAYCDSVAGAPMFAPNISSHLVTPAELMNLGAQEGWFQGK